LRRSHRINDRWQTQSGSRRWRETDSATPADGNGFDPFGLGANYPGEERDDYRPNGYSVTGQAISTSVALSALSQATDRHVVSGQTAIAPVDLPRYPRRAIRKEQGFTSRDGSQIGSERSNGRRLRRGARPAGAVS